MILKDHQFYECAKTLGLPELIPSDPDKRQIEKAFRKLALKTHPDKVSCKNKFCKSCLVYISDGEYHFCRICHLERFRKYN